LLFESTHHFGTEPWCPEQGQSFRVAEFERDLHFRTSLHTRIPSWHKNSCMRMHVGSLDNVPACGKYGKINDSAFNGEEPWENPTRHVEHSNLDCIRILSVLGMALDTTGAQWLSTSDSRGSK